MAVRQREMSGRNVQTSPVVVVDIQLRQVDITRRADAETVASIVVDMHVRHMQHTVRWPGRDGDAVTAVVVRRTVEQLRNPRADRDAIRAVPESA